MKTFTVSPRFPVSSFLLVALLVAPLVALAQPDPFGDPPAAAPAKGDNAPPVEAAAAAPPAAGKAAGKQPAVSPISLLAQTILDTNPTTATDLLRAIDTLARLNEVAVAKTLLSKLNAAKPDDAALLAALTELQSDTFFRLARIPDLQPDLGLYVDRALKLAKARNEDPARLHELIGKYLAATTDDEQLPLLTELLAGGDNTAAAAIQALGQPNLSPAARDRLRFLLIQLGQAAVEPLIAALATEDAAQRATALALLAEIGGRRQAMWLIGPALGYAPTNSPDAAKQKAQAAAQAALTQLFGQVPTVAEGAIVLRKEVQRLLSADPVFSADPNGNVRLWVWDQTKSTPVFKLIPLAAAQTIRAVRLAGDLHRLAPQDAVNRQLYLSALLRSEGYASGLDHEPKWSPEQLAALGEAGKQDVEVALLSAMAQRDAVAAAAAISLLGRLGLQSPLDGPRPHPVVQALRFPDRRVQYAAAKLLVNLRPAKPYSGSGFLTETLSHLARSTGARRGIAAFPNRTTATELAGFLEGNGIEGTPATTGQEAIRLAQQMPDAEVMLLSNRIDRTPLSITLQELRHDPRTARLPIVILVEDPAEEPKLRHLVDRDPLTTIFVRPYDETATQFAVNQSLRSAGDTALSPLERRAHGDFALLAMNQLRELNPQLYDFQAEVPLLIATLEDESRAEIAAAALAKIGNHAAQTALVEMASRSEVPLERRKLAVTSLTEAIRRRGIQLTPTEIARQYQRYNASAAGAADTQQILGAVLDALELPAKVAEGKETGG